MLNHKKSLLVLSFFFIPLNLISSESTISGITTKVFAYLKTKEVPYVLKKQLDGIFYRPEVMENLSKIYTFTDPEKGRSILIHKEGFDFINFNVFRHTSLRKYIFKISINKYPHNEMFNAGRIRFAEIINQKGKNIVRAPIKYAYMPYIFKDEFTELPICFQRLPICIVIAEYTDFEFENGCKIYRHYSQDKQKEEHDILQQIGYPVDEEKPSNISQFKDYCVVLDTEPFEIDLEYPEAS
ncbi:MAG: hypothetical protein P4L22_04930 [Candidatus Babeliales bacterium]|nr:hypothetical protein [Candidatus Babeliales bacterium]